LRVPSSSACPRYGLQAPCVSLDEEPVKTLGNGRAINSCSRGRSRSPIVKAFLPGPVATRAARGVFRIQTGHTNKIALARGSYPFPLRAPRVRIRAAGPLDTNPHDLNAPSRPKAARLSFLASRLPFGRARRQTIWVWRCRHGPARAEDLSSTKSTFLPRHSARTATQHVPCCRVAAAIQLLAPPTPARASRSGYGPA